MLALGVTNAWAEEVSLSGGTFANSKITWTAASGNITITQSKGSSGTAVSSSYVAAPRVYKGHILSFEAKEGYKIKQIDIKCNSTYYGNSMTAGTVINGTTVTNNTAEVNRSWTTSSNGTHVVSSVSPDGLSAIHIQNVATSNVQLRITAIEITYVEGTSTPTTTYTIKWHTAKGVTTDVTLNEDATISKPATDPTMTGYEFMGWTASCDVASDGSDFTALTDFGIADSDKDFYAVFAKATTTGGGTEEKEFTFNITKEDFNTTSYAANNNEKTSTAKASDGSTMDVKWTSYQVMQSSSVMQWQKDKGYIYNSTDLGTITNIEITSTAGTFTKYINNSKQPTSNGTGGYFQIKIGGATGKSSNIKVTFTQTVEGGGATTYDNYITTCASGVEYIELGDDFKWSATEAEVTIDATDNVFPSLTNTHNVPVTYSSSDNAIASIASDGSTVTLNKEGTVTITAKYAGGTSAGTGKEYKAKTVTYSLKVNKAVAQPTGTMYVKVTDAVTDGEYLIVYEAGNVAFDGSLTTLDAEGNMIEVQISSNTITGNTEIDAATFTIASMTGGHSIQSRSGKYIGRTSGSNGMNTGNSAIANVITFSNGAVKVAGSGSGASASLQYFAQSGSERFRYYTSAQKAIALYKKVDPNAVVEPIFTPVAGEYYGTQSVTISCATAGAEVYYTLDGTDPTSASTKYTGAISIASTTTVKAIAVKGANSSAVVSATYTILTPFATMQEIFDKATAVGGTATPVHVKMNNWVVTGVKNSNAYVTDGTKGLIIYKASHGFKVGDILSGTVACKVQLYNGSSELTELTSTTEGLTVTTGGVVTPVVVNDVTTLGGVNTGAIIKINGVCETKTINDKLYYYVDGVQLFNSLFTYDTPTVGGKYNVTGVYLQYNEIPEILPRSAADIEEIIDLPTATISIADITMEVGETKTIEAAITPDAAQSTVQYAITSGSEYITLDGTTITAVAAGEATITATIAEVAGAYNGTTKTFSVTVKPQNIAILPFEFTGVKADIENTLGMSQEGLGSDYTTAGVTTKLKFDGTGDCVIIHFNGQAEKLAYEIKGNGFSGGKFTVQQSADGSAYTDVVTYTELGDAATKEHELAAESRYVKFIYTEKSSGNVGLGNITISKADLRQETGLAWNPATVSLTVGDAFTAPTFSNPNSLAVSIESNNTELATVDNAGVISLVSGKTGTATITATYAGDATYKAAEVTCVITVSPKSEKVVILAEREGQWYALKAEYLSGKTDRLVAIPVDYFNGTLYNVAEEIKATIEWNSIVEGDKVSFLNDGKYLKGESSTTLLFEAGEDGLYQWDNTTYTMTIGTSVRSFLYNGEAFRNFAISNAGQTKDGITYSSLPVVTAPVYSTEEFVSVYTRSELPVGSYGTICLPYAVNNFTGATFYKVAGKEDNKIVFDEVTELEAGKPYIFMAEATEIKLAQVGEEYTGSAQLYNSLQGTFTQIDPAEDNILVDNYMLVNNIIKKCGINCGLKANRAYFVATELNGLEAPQSQMPGRRRISLNVTSENTTTGLDNITNGENTTIKVIENGQLIIIRNGEKFNAQGQRL